MPLSKKQQETFDALRAQRYVTLSGPDKKTYRELKALMADAAPQTPAANASETDGGVLSGVTITEGEKIPRGRRRAPVTTSKTTPAPMPSFVPESDAKTPPAAPAARTSSAPSPARAGKPPTAGQRFRHATILDSIEPPVHAPCAVIRAGRDGVTWGFVLPNGDAGKERGSFPLADADSHVREWA